jgi:hypothetical protein
MLFIIGKGWCDMKEYVLRARKIKKPKSGYIRLICPGETITTEYIQEAKTFLSKESAQDYCDDSAFCMLYYRPVVKRFVKEKISPLTDLSTWPARVPKNWNT